MKVTRLSSRLKHRIDVQVKNQVDNRRGGRRPPDGEAAWLTIASGIRAEVIALRGDEALKAGVERATQLWRVTIRPRADISTSGRLVWGAIVMEIQTAAPNLAGDELVMTCESGATGA